MKLSGWGRYPITEASVSAPRNEDEIAQLLRGDKAIARGNGRAYGDSAVNVSNTIQMTNFDRMLAFDPATGQLVAEAGVLLADVIEVFLRRGWFPAVTPGTKFVTLGGMIAADVHGKNHHKEGSFGRYVDWIEVLTPDGSVVRCSNTENADLFAWTIGGMGLTGVIIRAAFRLKRVSSAWIEQHTVVANDINHAIEIFEQSKHSTYSVAWIDCLKKGPALGRSLVILGEHMRCEDLPPKYQKTPFAVKSRAMWNVRFDFPVAILNALSVRAFNALYYWNGKRKPQRQIVCYERYFYPLDTILGWNKIYGRRGFVQFQCVIPIDHAKQGLNELLQAISGAGVGSFLAVLKRLGEQSSKFSFPMEGYTLALDFPVNKKTLDLMSKLDDITVKHNGRFYLAKDSRMSKEVFHQSEHRAEEYSLYRQDTACADTFDSAQSERLKF